MAGVFYQSVIHGLGFFICFTIIFMNVQMVTRGHLVNKNKTRFFNVSFKEIEHIQRGRKRKLTNREFGTLNSPPGIQFYTLTQSLTHGSDVIAASLATITVEFS